MVRPSFVVQHLIFCTSVEYPNVLRPLRDSTLNGVDYVLTAPAGTEFPFEPNEFWLFVRFYWMRDRPGSTPPLTVSCIWHDHPSGNEVEVWQRDMGRVRFLRPNDVIDRSWAFRNYPDDVTYFSPGVGLYEFRVLSQGRLWVAPQVKAREYIRVEI